MESFADIDGIVSAVREVAGDGAAPVPLHEPCFGGREWAYVKECLDAGWVSSEGAFVGRFERELAAATGSAHAVATVNGTAALHVALLAAGVLPGDEVVVPALTFVATANAVAHCGAVPHFADSEERTLGLDPAKLGAHLSAVADLDRGACVDRATGRPIRAVVPVHAFGHPVDLAPLAALCSELGLALVEDAAEALGSLYRGRHAGTIGRLGILSFNGNKILTTGGGGAVLAGEGELAERLRHLTTTAKLPHRWAYFHDRVAYNYRMPNLNAALGCAQLEQLPAFLAAKRTLAGRYREALAGVGNARLFAEPPFARSNHWLNVLLLDAPDAAARDRVLEHTHAAGLLTRPAWTLLHRLPMFAGCPRMDLGVAEELEARLVCLPSSAALAAGVGAGRSTVARRRNAAPGSEGKPDAFDSAETGH